MYVGVCRVCLCCGESVKVKRKFVGFSSLFPPCMFWGLNAGHQFWWQVPLPERPFCQSLRPGLSGCHVTAVDSVTQW